MPLAQVVLDNIVTQIITESGYIQRVSSYFCEYHVLILAKKAFYKGYEAGNGNKEDKPVFGELSNSFGALFNYDYQKIYASNDKRNLKKYLSNIVELGYQAAVLSRGGQVDITPDTTLDISVNDLTETLETSTLSPIRPVLESTPKSKSSKRLSHSFKPTQTPLKGATVSVTPASSVNNSPDVSNVPTETNDLNTTDISLQVELPYQQGEGSCVPEFYGEPVELTQRSYSYAEKEKLRLQNEIDLLKKSMGCDAGIIANLQSQNEIKAVELERKDLEISVLKSKQDSTSPGLSDEGLATSGQGDSELEKIRMQKLKTESEALDQELAIAEFNSNAARDALNLTKKSIFAKPLDAEVSVDSLEEMPLPLLDGLAEMIAENQKSIDSLAWVIDDITKLRSELAQAKGSGQVLIHSPKPLVSDEEENLTLKSELELLVKTLMGQEEENTQLVERLEESISISEKMKANYTALEAQLNDENKVCIEDMLLAQKALMVSETKKQQIQEILNSQETKLLDLTDRNNSLNEEFRLARIENKRLNDAVRAAEALSLENIQKRGEAILEKDTALEALSGLKRNLNVEILALNTTWKKRIDALEKDKQGEIDYVKEIMKQNVLKTSEDLSKKDDELIKLNALLQNAQGANDLLGNAIQVNEAVRDGLKNDLAATKIAAERNKMSRLAEFALGFAAIIAAPLTLILAGFSYLGQAYMNYRKMRSLSVAAVSPSPVPGEETLLAGVVHKPSVAPVTFGQYLLSGSPVKFGLHWGQEKYLPEHAPKKLKI